MREPTNTTATYSAPDRLVASDRFFAPGAHLVSPRPGYTHHGVYVGGGRIVQYVGFMRGLRRGAVEEVGLQEFSNGRGIQIRYGRPAIFDADEVVRRARSRIGEDRYHLLTNNCEHFCEWCIRAEHRSYQVEDLLSPVNLVLRIARWTLRKIRIPGVSQNGLIGVVSGHRC